MTETLEYQKENGLLWQEVYAMMNNWSPEQMLQFIEEHDSDYKQNSSLQNQQNSQETKEEVEMWVDNRRIKEKEADWNSYYNSAAYDSELKEANREKAFTAYNENYSAGKDAAEAAANKVFEDAKKAADQSSSNSNQSDTPPKPEETEPPITLTGQLVGGNVNMR
jgi:hypothetical protein